MEEKMELDYQLDKNEYDFIVLGTNIEESIISSVISFRKYTVLNIDMDDNYCSS